MRSEGVLPVKTLNYVGSGQHNREGLACSNVDSRKCCTASNCNTYPEFCQTHSESTASAVSAGAPQAIQVADRFHVAKNLSEAVQQLLARVLLEMKTASQGAEAATQAPGDSLLPIEEWRPAQEESVKQTIATRRAERQERYQQVLALSEQGLPSQQIAGRLGMKARTVRDWLHKGVAPDTRPRRKYRSEFDPYAPYVLKRWQEGQHSGRQLWREVRYQGYSGSERMVYRFLETLKTTEVVTSAGTPRLSHYTSTAAVWLFMRREDAFGRDPTRRSGGFSPGTYVPQ